jgi:gliding motility-associated lipoprotein GldH
MTMKIPDPIIKRLIMFASIVIFCNSCDHVYKQYKKEQFTMYRWQKNEPVIFEPEIINVDDAFKITIGLRHIYGFRLPKIPVRILTISPSGGQEIKQYELQIKDAKGSYIGSCAGDLCDFETVIEESIRLKEAGKYQYKVFHDLPVETITGILEVGLIIDAVKE